MQQSTIGVAFGGVSPEHEVSIISSLQAAAAMDRTKYRVVPLYLAKDGWWYSGEALLRIEAYGDLPGLLKKAFPIDIVPGGARCLHVRERSTRRLFARKPRFERLDLVFLGLHGGAGENGGMQGLCEVLDVPYTGSGILASALAMDKVRAKAFCRSAGIPVVASKRIRESEWSSSEEEWLDRLEAAPGFPLIVKPVKLGSSVGIAKASSRPELDEAIEEAFRYDEEVIVEQAVDRLREINCSVLGDEDDAVASVLEEPVSASGLLSYADKYMSSGSSGSAVKGLRSGTSTDDTTVPGSDSISKSGAPGGMASQQRRIPADLPDDVTGAIRSMAVKIFRLLGCAGVCRIDFLMDGASGQVYFNEINTIPGSFSFYLWERSEITFDLLVERLIEIGRARYEARTNRVRSYDVNLLSERATRGLKGAKS
jgi:D-alanine-D-alanine ligase